MRPDKDHDTSNQHYLRAGEVIFPTEPTEVTTVLGSCISVWIVDIRLGHSSICHFKGPRCNPRKPATAMFADFAIARQIEGMMELGSRRRDLHAYIIGGGNVMDIPGEIGRANTEAAIELLRQEGIKVTYQDTGGTDGRKVKFNTLDKSVDIHKVPIRLPSADRNTPLNSTTPPSSSGPPCAR